MDDNTPPDIMRDVYEGDVFRRFSHLLKPNPLYLGLSFQLNIDWFQPYKKTECSAGAVYPIMHESAKRGSLSSRKRHPRHDVQR